MTVINKEYTLNCSVCSNEVNLEEVEKGSTFTAYELSCNNCSNAGFMFSIFVPTTSDLVALISEYKKMTIPKEDQ